MNVTLVRRDGLPVLLIDGQQSTKIELLLEFLNRDVSIRERVNPKRGVISGIEIAAKHTEQTTNEAQSVEQMAVAELQEAAAKLGIDIDKRWGRPRLITEIRKHNAADE